MNRHRLTELRPEWLGWTDDKHFHRVNSIQEADGIILLCPMCYEDNGCSDIGVHSVICWEPNVPQSTYPVPGRWELVGTSFEDLTLRAGSSSIQLIGGCNAHFFINNGDVHP